jgi:hypothetical protein
VSDYIDFDALWRVAALSAGFGVGVVGLYALGIAAISAPEGGAAVGPLRRGVAMACFAVCAVVIVVGAWAILDK